MSTDAASQFTIDGCTPERIVCPASIDELAQCAASAHAANLAVIPVGNGTQLHVGRAPTRYDVALSTQRLNRILAHEAADMTVTVEAGITLADLNAALAPAGQRLPLDPPHPERTTIGALIATDACGPLRLSQGKVRDLLIGITVVLADGTLVHGGGRVVKNVAGYDLMKLFTGSFGTLGIIVEATFKLRPVAEHEAVFVLPASGTEAAVVLGLKVPSAQVTPHYVEVVNAAACGMRRPRWSDRRRGMRWQRGRDRGAAPAPGGLRLPRQPARVWRGRSGATVCSAARLPGSAYAAAAGPSAGLKPARRRVWLSDQRPAIAARTVARAHRRGGRAAQPPGRDPVACRQWCCVPPRWRKPSR